MATSKKRLAEARADSPAEIKERAVRMVHELRREDPEPVPPGTSGPSDAIRASSPQYPLIIGCGLVHTPARRYRSVPQKSKRRSAHRSKAGHGKKNGLLHFRVLTGTEQLCERLW